MNREKVLIQPSPTHSRPTRASSESGCGADHIRTANAAAQAEMRLSAAICTANMAGVADGEWALISPYGDHASPDGSYTQRFSREQAEKVVKTWNSITGTAARAFKNVMHGLGAKFSIRPSRSTATAST